MTQETIIHTTKADEDSPVARIFNIQRYSLNDGNGIRTVIFFKGCPHRCPWCANPESISRRIETVRRESKCIHCTTCLNDVNECPSGAFQAIGYDITLDSLLKKIIQDEIFFRSSGGGVTLSGGEVLLQGKFAAKLLERLQQLGIHTAIETAGDSHFDNIYTVAKYCDQVLFDLKIMDETQAKHVLNLHLSRVLDNFTQLYQHNINLIPRIPLIPNYTLSSDNITKVLDFLSPFKNIKEVHLLPFHQYGESKYKLLNLPYQLATIKPPTEQQVEELKQRFEHNGYTVMIGG